MHEGILTASYELTICMNNLENENILEEAVERKE
jgi:hypothetical protein